MNVRDTYITYKLLLTASPLNPYATCPGFDKKQREKPKTKSYC